MFDVHLRNLRQLCFSLFAILFFATPFIARADETIPPVPPHYCNDDAGVLSAGTRQSLDDQLKQFEAATSNQIVVAIYNKMQSRDDVAAYCTHVMQAWHVGQKGKDNGVVLFVFVQDHQMFIATGYGLEGALPDATCKAIIENDIKPHFKAGDYSGGVTAGVNSIISATKGEYKGNGHTAGDNPPFPPWLVPVAFFLIFLLIQSLLRRYTGYGRSGRYGGWSIGPFIGGGFGGGGGGFGGGGGGGFSGGGGSTGGGGAGGSW